MSDNQEHETMNICQKTMLHVEKSFWQKLNPWTNLKMRFHLFICKNCLAYEKDSKVIHRILCSLKSSEQIEPLRKEELNQLKKALN